MNQSLSHISAAVEGSETLSAEQKKSILDWIKEVDKYLSIVEFKLDRTEKVKRTTAILLEETIQELEQKRKAVEAQNRELEIESSLERVRTAAMSMKKPDDLLFICDVLFKELKSLGFTELRNTLIHTYVDEESYFIDYDYSDYTGGGISHIPYKGVPFIENYIFEIRKSKEAFTEMVVTGEELEVFKEFRKTTGQLEDLRLDHASALYYYNYSIGVGDVGISTFSPISEEKREVLKRFRNVFDFAYRRYMDVAQAEMQAREATIEASLEKVRGEAMAMHNSSDLSSTILLAYSELKKLGFTFLHFGVGLINKETRKAQWYSVNPIQSGDDLAMTSGILFEGHPVFEAMYDSWIKLEDYFPVLEGEPLTSYYDLLTKGLSVPSLPMGQTGEKKYGLFSPHPVSCLYAWSENAFKEVEIKVLKRFASIIELTFRRYLELQQSEAGAREAVKQSSLDRVRAEIASMRTVEDLNSITPIVWRELNILGVPFFRCGVFIINVEERLVHVYLSTPEGKSLAVLHLGFDGAEITINSVNHWLQQKVYIEHWKREQFMAWVQSLKVQGQVESEQTYQAGQEPPETMTLQFVPFAQGMLYIGSTEPLNEDQLQLVKELSNAFSVAFARYEDFKKLEEAKTKIETTLVELKAAQAQLIQSEKMASLGELTAGIAHEIQNPLNFVNNFAEINRELIEEIREERLMLKAEGGKTTEDLILETMKENQDKILQHGKRADAIVKSMLEHSRVHSRKKEPTDLNALCEEYLRLAFHGYRAKDRDFNAHLELNLDPDLPHVNVLPQDIGRVLLNLINNAFYAVQELNKSKKTKGELYSPTVAVTTKSVEKAIEIRVKDNGPGIPQEVVGKIFQPFFTTKPTGQGTGLGLSLAYDIVKAHGGSIHLISTPEGSDFQILLPAS